MTSETEEKSNRNLGRFAPIAVFALVAGLFLYALQSGDRSALPSMLIDKPLPEFTAPPLAGTDMPGFSSSTLADGKAATIINVWASWCVSCRTEHPFLSRLAEKSGARLYGLNYKDTTAAANRFLQRFGNPYIAIGVDKPGRIGIDLGVYGVPETFIISGEGKVIYRHPGPVNDRIIDEVLVPLVRKPKQKG